MKRVIAIDGPAGAGKSTVAKEVAKRLGYLYIDTGAMYRAVAFLAREKGISVDDQEGLTKIAENCQIDLEANGDQYLVKIDGRDVTKEIRTAEIGKDASPVSAVSGVRRALVMQQRRLAGENKVIMDGRDIGTVVLPNADCKIFLTAGLDIRALRRFLELKEKGQELSLMQIKEDIAERDYRDSHRADSPLKQADDAILLDTSKLTEDQVILNIIELIGE